jgi:glycerophosphoryl diester phosphodiesterase
MYHANEMNTPYPRLCAHRGFNALAPENSLPALTMAMAIGAQEIEMDVWTSKDGDLIVCHDPTVDRTTNGTGRISEMTTKELLSLDAGSYYSPAYRGIRLPLFEEVLDLAAGKVILDIHIKSPGRVYRPCEEIRARNRIISQGYWNHAVIMPPLPEEAGEIYPEADVTQLTPYPEKDFQKLLDLLDKYNCRDYAYICGEADVMATALRMAPDVPRCNLEGHNNYTIVEHAIAYQCKKLTFTKGYTTRAMVQKAHDHGIACNMFWCDDETEARAYFDAGIDCVLTNNIGPVANALK